VSERSWRLRLGAGQARLDLRDELPGLLQVGLGAVAEGFVVSERGLGVFEGVCEPAGTSQGDGHVELGHGGAVDIPRGFELADCLAVVVEGAADVAGTNVDIAQLVVGDREVLHLA